MAGGCCSFRWLNYGDWRPFAVVRDLLTDPDTLFGLSWTVVRIAGEHL